jgi:superfamily I DNA/RNA helicase
MPKTKHGVILASKVGSNMPIKIKIWGSPGCGKTTKLMDNEHGYQYLLSRGYGPSDITLITYRRSSAFDLIGKVSKYVYLGDKEIRKHVGTLHSICFRLIGYPEMITDEDRFNFVSEFGYKKYIKFKKTCKQDDEKVSYDVDAFCDDDIECSGDIFEFYTWCHSTCTSPEKWFKYPSASSITMKPSEIPKFFKDYDTYKRRIGKVDFSDMLQRILDEKILLDTPVLMVDEFQDLTAQMYKIFELWYPNCEYVMIAGDPNQSIYGYAGGSPDYYLQWKAKEIILDETYRLPEQIKNFSQSILRATGVKPPFINAKNRYNTTVVSINYSDNYPEHPTELHLVRCNYQAPALALRLAEDGKVFGGSNVGWTTDEINLANAIIATRNNKIILKEQLLAIAEHYPLKLLGIDELRDSEKEKKEAFINNYLGIDNPLYLPPQGGSNVLKKEIIDVIKSQDPTKWLIRDGKLFRAKIFGVINRSDIITHQEIRNRRIMTIHAAKGLEADAAFLHTSITPTIRSAMFTSTKAAQAEARVWYVGASRAREILYIVNDVGKTYELPRIPKIVSL